jgi:glycosyltransferase involved in cell wall biosynthesis
VPNVFGPVTGGEQAPAVLAEGGGIGFRASNAARLLLRTSMMTSRRWKRFTRTPGNLQIAATEETARLMRRAGASGVEVFRPSFALTAEQLAEVRGYPTAEAAGGPLRFMCSGRMIPWKGHALAIQAFATVLPRHPDATLHVAGWGPEEENLRRLATDLGIAHAVVFHGRLDREQERRRMADSHVFVLPSIRDVGSTLMVHAMAMGRPIAAFETGAVGPMTDGASLRAAPARPDDAARALGDVLRTLADDEPLRTEMGTIGRRRVDELYTADVVHEALEGWYGRAVQRA